MYVIDMFSDKDRDFLNGTKPVSGSAEGSNPEYVNEASLASMRDYFNQSNDDTVDVARNYASPERKKPTAGIPPEIQSLVNKMYHTSKITPQEFKMLQDFQIKTKINVGIKETGQLDELFEPTLNYYTLSNGKMVQASYRPNVNQSPVPLTDVTVSYVNPALKPQGGSFDSTGVAEPWTKAPDGVKQAIQKFVTQPQKGVVEAGTPFRGVGGAFNRGDDEHHEIDRAREQQSQSGTWYIRLNGKLIRDKQGNPYSFRGKAAANKAALTMQAKLFNQGKEFMLTTNPNDKEAGVTEMDKSQTPPGRDGHVSHGTYGSRDEKDPDSGKKQYTAKGITSKQATNVATGILSKAFKDSQRVDPRTGKKMVQKGVAEGSSESVSLRDMVDVVDKHYPKYYAELSGSDISDRQFERAIVNAYKKIMQKQGVAEGYQLDEGAIETITALAKKIPGIGKYYQMAQQYKPQLIEILKTSKSGKEVKQKMEQLAAGQSATVAESGMMKQLGGLAVGGGSILSTMWMNAMGMIDGVLAHAAAGEVGGAVASGSILGLIPITLMLFAAMLMFKGSKQSSDEKAQAFQAQRGQQGVAEGSEYKSRHAHKQEQDKAYNDYRTKHATSRMALMTRAEFAKYQREKAAKNKQGASGELNEFAPAGGGGSGDYFQALASAWYNGVFNTGSLPKGIKTQVDVERLLNRGIVCPDGKTRKLHIDYNSDFNGVEIYSDDYYEYGDDDDTIDSRTGKKWGPYDFMAFSDDDLSESAEPGVTEVQVNEFLPAVAAGVGTLARGAAVSAQALGGAALKGAQALGGAALKGAQAVTPGLVKGTQSAGNAVTKGAQSATNTIRKGVQAVAPTAVTAGQAISKVPGATERGIIRGFEVLNALVPGGIFGKDGYLKGTEYLRNYIDQREIQQLQKEYGQNQQQGVAEVSDATLTSYLTKLDKDNLKHKMDPTRRSDAKRMKSGPNFVKAFTKLDNRKQGVAEGENWDKLTPQQKAHEYNLDAAQKEMDRRHEQGEDMSGAKIDKKTYKIVKPKQQGVTEVFSSPMIKPPSNRFDTKQEAFAYAKQHGGKVFKSTYIDPNTGNKSISFVVKNNAEQKVNELSRDTLKSYSQSAAHDVHADQRDAEGARKLAYHADQHGEKSKSLNWADEADWLDKRAEKRAGGIARATTKIAQKDVNEGRVKELDMDLKSLSDSEFLAKYKKTKLEIRAIMKSKVEESSTESRPRIRKFTSMRPDGSKFARYEVLDYMGRRVGNAFDDLKFAKQYFYRNYDKLASLDEDVSTSNPTDTVTMDVPLLIRVMEFAREDAQSDMDLHHVAEKLISLSSNGNTLDMDLYNQIIPGTTAKNTEPTVQEGNSRVWSSAEKRWIDQ